MRRDRRCRRPRPSPPAPKTSPGTSTRLLAGTCVDDLVDDALGRRPALTADAKGTIADLDAAGLRARARPPGRHLRGRPPSRRTTPSSASPPTPATPHVARWCSGSASGCRQLSAELVWFELEWVAVDDDRGRRDRSPIPASTRTATTSRPCAPASPTCCPRPRSGCWPTPRPPGGRRGSVCSPSRRRPSRSTYPAPDDAETDVASTRRSPGSATPTATFAATAADAVSAPRCSPACAPGPTSSTPCSPTVASRTTSAGYPTWISSWNLSNEASDESVAGARRRRRGPLRHPAALVPTQGRRSSASTGSPTTTATRRWPRPTATSRGTRPRRIVRDAYASFSDELASVVDRFLDEGWIDAPVRPGKRGGAFCAYTVPGHHPYVFLNYTATPNDVMTLAHELGHGLHGYLARAQGVFEQMTPLTLAETASVFGETVTFNRLLSQIDDPAERFALLAQNVEGSIATVFRQVSMNRFEHAVHTHRRERRRAVDHRLRRPLGRHPGRPVRRRDGGHRRLPRLVELHPALHRHARLRLRLRLRPAARPVGLRPVRGPRRRRSCPSTSSCCRPAARGGPRSSGRIVDCDLADPSFWSAGLDIVDAQVTAAEEAARSGRPDLNRSEYRPVPEHLGEADDHP